MENLNNKTRIFFFKIMYIVEEYDTLETEWKHCQKAFQPIADKLLSAIHKKKYPHQEKPEQPPPGQSPPEQPEKQEQQKPQHSEQPDHQAQPDHSAQPPPSEGAEQIPSLPEDDVLPAEDESKSNDILYIYFKSLYKKMVLLTHPDKSRTDKYNSFYIELEKEFKSGNFVKLLRIALKLKFDHMLPLELDNMTDEQQVELEAKIKSMEKHSTEIKNSLIWQYFHTNDDGKQHLESLFTQQMEPCI